MPYTNIEIDNIDRSFDGTTCPSVTGTTVPVVFPEPIEVDVQVEITFNYGADSWLYKYTVSGTIDQYSTNNQYPHIGIDIVGEVNNTPYSLAVSCSNPSARFTGTSNEKRFQNGQQTTDYSTATLGFSFTRSSDPTYTTNCHLNIIKSTLPVIFRYTTNTVSDLYSEYPDTYFMSDTIPYAQVVNKLPLVLQGYDYSKTLNIAEDVEPDGTVFEIRNMWTTGEWTQYGQPPVTNVNYRCLRGKIISGRMCYYPVEGVSEGSLKYQIVSDAVFYGLEKSTDGNTWEPVSDNLLPFTFFYRPRVNELGLFNYGLTFENDTIPRFKDDEEADDYIDEILNPEDADNWDQISPNYPDPRVPGDDPDAVTEFGEVGAQSIFSQQYIIPLSVLYELANTFYDTTTAGLWDDIKKGLQMYGDSPIEAIENLSFYPYDLSSVFPVSSQNYIYFGGYQMQLTQGSANRIVNPNGDIDLGSVSFPRIYNNWMDFEPYCKLFVNVPYCGEYQLDLSEYYNKTLSVKYFVDTRTGSCCCCLLADDHLVDKFNGQMGVQMPIKLTDFSAYANAQIQTLLGMGGQSMQLGGNFAQAANAGIAGGAGAAAVAGVGALAAGTGGIMGAKTVYGLAQNNINRFNKTKGGSTSMLNMYMPQTVCFTFEMNVPDIPDNFYRLNGYPTNVGGNIGKFSGFLKCDTVKLNMPGATDLEYEKARGLLLAGVYI